MVISVSIASSAALATFSISSFVVALIALDVAVASSLSIFDFAAVAASDISQFASSLRSSRDLVVSGHVGHTGPVGHHVGPPPPDPSDHTQPPALDHILMIVSPVFTLPVFILFLLFHCLFFFRFLVFFHHFLVFLALAATHSISLSSSILDKVLLSIVCVFVGLFSILGDTVFFILGEFSIFRLRCGALSLRA